MRAIAGRSGKDPRTVVAAYAGLASPEAARMVASAAVELGFAPPKGR